MQRPGLEVVPIEVDAEGMQTGDLSEVAVDAAIVAPAHQFPTGMVLTPERRMLLLEWACGVYWHAAALGKPRVLGQEQLDAVVEQVVSRRYGQTKERE